MNCLTKTYKITVRKILNELTVKTDRQFDETGKKYLNKMRSSIK